ncbi:hypothetical protein Q8F55_001064 [Vanrija albida]|uniref:Uncharacterized protein n=1 Tax=Vanrija albida TaxID=181172 RepID=A0ABR3QF24_9TREE
MDADAEADVSTLATVSEATARALSPKPGAERAGALLRAAETLAALLASPSRPPRADAQRQVAAVASASEVLRAAAASTLIRLQGAEGALHALSGEIDARAVLLARRRLQAEWAHVAATAGLARAGTAAGAERAAVAEADRALASLDAEDAALGEQARALRSGLANVARVKARYAADAGVLARVRAALARCEALVAGGD